MTTVLAVSSCNWDTFSAPWAPIQSCHGLALLFPLPESLRQHNIPFSIDRRHELQHVRILRQPSSYPSLEHPLDHKVRDPACPPVEPQDSLTDRAVTVLRDDDVQIAGPIIRPVQEDH